MNSGKRHSHLVTDGPNRAPARAMMKAIGFTDEDLAKPLIGIANTWTETMPCNFGLRALAEHVKRGVRSAGGTPMEFNTVAVSDGVSMGTSGMRASLVSREVIADSIELVCRGHLFDGLDDLVVNPGRIAVFFPAVNHPMADRFYFMDVLEDAVIGIDQGFRHQGHPLFMIFDDQILVPLFFPRLLLDPTEDLSNPFN